MFPTHTLPITEEEDDEPIEEDDIVNEIDDIDFTDVTATDYDVSAEREKIKKLGLEDISKSSFGRLMEKGIGKKVEKKPFRGFK